MPCMLFLFCALNEFIPIIQLKRINCETQRCLTCSAISPSLSEVQIAPIVLYSPSQCDKVPYSKRQYSLARSRVMNPGNDGQKKKFFEQNGSKNFKVIYFLYLVNSQLHSPY
jgi:hypothetical protein